MLICKQILHFNVKKTFKAVQEEVTYLTSQNSGALLWPGLVKSKPIEHSIA